MNSLEDRLREAYHAAADTVRPETVLPGGVRGLHGDGHPAARPGRRRRSRSPLLVPLAAAVAVTVVVGTVYVLGSQLFRGAGPQQPPASPTLYIYSYGYSGEVSHTDPLGRTVTPVNTATGAPGKPIHVGVPGGPPKDYYGLPPGGQIVITPDGKTAYLTTGSSVTPVNTATGTPGKPIRVGLGRFGVSVPQIAITPNGKTAYVTGPFGWVTPISTATNTPGKPIHVAGGHIRAIAITPNGKTAYVTTNTGAVTPITTATNTVGAAAYVNGGPRSWGGAIAITPDGKTAYVTTLSGVTPITTATNTPGTPIFNHGQADSFGPGSASENIAITPDGKTVYVLNQNGSVTPINTATNKPGPLIGSGRFNALAALGGTGQIAITPDGKTVYAMTWADCNLGAGGHATCPVTVTPINTATNAPDAPITFDVAAGSISQIAITPDGKTAYATTGSTVTPISTATNTPGTPIHVPGAGYETIAITP